MKQQILDMERELTKSVKDQSDNLAVIDDQRSKLVASSSELVAARRRVGGLQTGMARWPPFLTSAHNFFCNRLLKEVEAMQPLLGDSKKLKEVGGVCDQLTGRHPGGDGPVPAPPHGGRRGGPGGAQGGGGIQAKGIP